MKVKLLVVAVAVLALASLSFAQGINWYNETWIMTKSCGSGAALPIGTPIYIMNDTDGDGWVDCANPDNDPPPPLCDDPPLCEMGPGGTFGFDVLHIGDSGNPAGRFANDPIFLAAYAPPEFLRFYLKIVYAETTVTATSVCIHKVTYLSRVVSCPTSDITEADMGGPTNWTCCVWDTCWFTIPPCTPDLFTVFTGIPWDYRGPLQFHDCAVVCAPQPHTVSVGPLAAPSRLPHGFVIEGCPVGTPCDSECVPAQGWTFGPLTFTLRYSPIPAPTGSWWYDAVILPLTGATDGCICIIVDFIESAEIGDVAVVPLSNSVKITWRTLSETSLDAFTIYRDGDLLTTKDAANTPGGAEYEYVDSDVENGRTYNYDLRAVDINGAETSFHTASVTPSFENALVTEYALHQNYPNPFNPTTKIAFDLVDNNPVTLTVYNATGQVVATLIDGAQYTKGRHAIAFDSGSLTSGLYFYTVKIGNEFTATKKMLLVK